jgi:hypothetical protein
MTHPNNAEYQRQFRKRQAEREERLGKLVTELREENALLKSQIENAPPLPQSPDKANLSKMEFPEYRRGRGMADMFGAKEIGDWLERELLANRISHWMLMDIAGKAAHLSLSYTPRNNRYERLQAPRKVSEEELERNLRHIFNMPALPPPANREEDLSKKRRRHR